jgi:hypothetical protein
MPETSYLACPPARRINQALKGESDEEQREMDHYDTRRYTMKEKQTVREKTIVIDIKLTRRVVTVLACVLTMAALLAYLMLARESAAAAGQEASPAQSNGMRQFYLTRFHDGNDALTACAEGYHFASLWELADPSNLKYNTSLSYVRPDSGQGPPQQPGWVRTGYTADASDTPGRGNCAAWTSDQDSDHGTTALLPSDWTGGEQDMDVWQVYATNTCNIQSGVWCIED